MIEIPDLSQLPYSPREREASPFDFNDSNDGIESIDKISKPPSTELRLDEELYTNTSAFMIGPRTHLDSASSFNPDDSKVSLPLSEDLSAQIIEFDTAHSVAMHKINKITLLDPPPGKYPNENQNHPSTNTFINQKSSTACLQAPMPDKIQTNKVNVKDTNLSYYDDSFPLKLQDPPTMKDPVSGTSASFSDLLPLDFKSKFTSPVARRPQRDHVEPSPQLPPPLSAVSPQQLRFSSGEEFAAVRRDLATDQKSPAEYTLHIIFTQFVRHAERKLNLCIDYPLNEELPVIDLLAEGVDPLFDKIVASLGYIARRKPKPVIDSVMFWRKNKSEIASMAAAEVERTLAVAKTDLSRVSSEVNSINVAKNPQPPGRGKRSLSLMRTKSFSKMTHRRNQSAAAVPVAVSRSPSFDDPRSLVESNFMKQKSFYDDQIVKARETAIQADRKSLASIYILCRVLIEVVKQTSYDTMGPDLGDKLEDIVYTQMKTTDPITTSESLVRSSNWNLFAELLGYMSKQRFLNISDRFIADLEKIPVNVKQEDEPSLHLLIHGMRYLNLTNYPLETFEEGADFMFSLAKFFEKSQNESIMYAYCEVLSNLVLPLANVLTAETNHPTWAEAVEKIYSKACKIWNQYVRYDGMGSSSAVSLPSATLSLTFNPNNGWAYSITLITSILSVSRKELFSKVWFDVIENNIPRLRAKADVEDRTTFIVCIARLVWVYVYRLPDTLNNTVKKLENLFDIIFFSPSANNKKNQWLSANNYLITVLVELVHIVGYQHLNFVLDHVLLKLLKLSFNGVNLENSSPERLILIVRSYLAILNDYEHGKKPQFPVDEVFNERMKNVGFKKAQNDFLFIAKNSTNAATHDEICRSFATLLKLLDGQCGSDVWSLDSNPSTPVSTTFAKSQSAFSFHFGIDFSYQTKDLQIELFATLLDAVPWTLVLGEMGSQCSGIHFKNVVEILTRNCVHGDPKVAKAALGSLKKLASRKNPTSLMTLFAKIAFRFSDKPQPSYDSDYLNSVEFNKLLNIYVDLLRCWLQQFREMIEIKKDNPNPLAQDDELMNKDVLNDLYQINHKNDDLSNNIGGSVLKPSDELEWKSIITVIEEVEGNGLFFLCSQDAKTRHYGVSILQLVDEFDQAIYVITDTKEKEHNRNHSRTSSKFAADIGTRLIHILLEGDFLELIKPFRKELSVPERTRLGKLKNKKRILVRLAESDYGIDSTLWFRVFPKLLDIFFEKCPMPVAMCRSIVCVRMVQMHELVFEFSESYKNYTTSLFARPNSNVAPEVLVNQWKLYLVFACCSLTSTNEQKISFPNQPTHGRKRSMQIFIQHQKITSAKSVFRMVLPLLKSQQPMVRDAVITGLSCININILKTFLENLPSSVVNWDAESKRDSAEDRLRVETVHILSNITERFQSRPEVYEDEWMIANLVSVIKNVKLFLSVPSVQTSVDFQRLRRYFCKFLENVFVGLQEMSNVDRWLPFEARIGCFNFLKEWCGYGDGDITGDRYAAMHSKSHKKDASVIAILEIERSALQLSALSCMSVLCSSPIRQEIEVPGKTAVMTFDIQSLMGWIYALLESEAAQEIGKKALENILVLNINSDDVYDEVVKQCYISQGSLRVTELYFTTFVEVYMKHRHIESLPYDILCLSTILTGSDNFQVRFSAIKLLLFIESKFLTDSSKRFIEGVCSPTKVVYKRALFDISVQLAALHPSGAFTCISYLTLFFIVVNHSTRRDILACLLPWVQTVELSYTEKREDRELDASSVMVLNNLFELTVKFSSTISNEVEALWVALGSSVNNFDMILEYIMNNCLERKSPLFVDYSRQIIDYLAFSQAEPIYIIDKLIANLQPKALVPPSHISPMNFSKDYPYVANLWKTIPYNEKDAAFSLGQLSMIFLVDLFTVQNDRMVEQLPLLLHVTFSLLDHYLTIVQEQACSLLIHLIHCLAPESPKSVETIELLRQKDHYKYLWVYDDLNNDKKGARTPRNMDILARNALEIFSPSVPSLQHEWSKVSLNWATTCAVRHIACRSFQLFRSLLSFLDQGMLKDMLHRLSNTISDDSADIQGFAMQILMTINAITAELDSENLIDFPQLFWSGVACLSTVHEQEFIEVLSAMNKFVSKIDLDSPETVSCLISTFPPEWEGKFEGLQHVVMVGLRSATAYEPSMKFLDKLNRLKDSEVIGMGNLRVLTLVLANMPRFLHALDQKLISPDIEETALVMSEMAEAHGKPSLARILVSLAKNRFRSKKDFLVQTIATIRNGFFPEFETQTLVLLLGFLTNKLSWVKLETMSLLKHIFSLVDLQRDEFVGVGADLISPLLRLLLTDYAEPALEVLDEAVVISGSQLDKDVLRMSLGNAAMKKEYEKTRTLFGIPDDSGWAIPMPAMTAATTRHNVHSVFSTCAVATALDESKNKDEDIQFHMEDYYGPDNTDTVSVTVDEPASLSNMWAALDDFDSFFTKESGPASGPAMLRNRENFHTHSASSDTKYSDTSDSLTPMDSAPVVYDKNASYILNQSLARTQSNTSFKSSLADPIGNSKYGYPARAPKRSYVPFRNSRNYKKNDLFTTPVMQLTSTFDEKVPSNDVVLPGTIQDTPSSENSLRFDNILSNKKKSKKNVSPNMSNQFWSPKSGSNDSASTAGTPKIVKKRVSQKFRQ